MEPKTDFLLKRRQEVVDRHLLLEGVQGSGHHPDDPAARERRGAGLSKTSDRITTLHHDGVCWVVGTDVPRFRAELTRWLEADGKATAEAKERASAAGLEIEPPTAQHRQAASVASRVVSDNTDVIRLRSNEFNATLYCLTALNIPVVSAGVLG